MAKYRFSIGELVHVTARGDDPGGTGVVTAREEKEDARGVEILYRVRIDGNPAQVRGAERSRRAHDGFWYKDALVGDP